MQMIGKLSKDWKVDWLNHLPELMHAYNSTRSAITRYSPPYLMFGHWPHLPIDFYFPTIRGPKITSVLTTSLMIYVNGCEKPLKRLKYSPHQMAKDRNGTMIGKLTPFQWNQVTWPWLKLMPIGDGGKWRTGGRRNHMKWSARLPKVSFPTMWRNQQAVHSWLPHQNHFSHHS